MGYRGESVAHARPGLLKTPVHSGRLCIPNLHPISWSLLPSANAGVIYLSTAHSSPDHIASLPVWWDRKKGHWGKLAAYVGTSPWHRHQREVAGVKRKHVATQTLNLWSLARDLGHWVWSGTYEHQSTQWPQNGAVRCQSLRFQ